MAPKKNRVFQQGDDTEKEWRFQTIFERVQLCLRTDGTTVDLSEQNVCKVRFVRSAFDFIKHQGKGVQNTRTHTLWCDRD